MIFKCSTQEKWRQIAEDTFYQEEIDKIKADALYYLENPPLVIPYSQYRLFYEIGDRAQYQKAYFERRKRMDIFAFMSLLTGEKCYLTELENIIWMICDEFTWELPAHVDRKIDINSQKNTVALFSTETAASLSEICYLLSDRLDDQVKNRVWLETWQRVIQPFLQTPDFRWEHYANNWVSVCCSNIGIALMAWDKRECFNTVKPRLLKNLYAYISSFPADGACAEGYGYWKLGIGCYVQFAHMYQEYTRDTSLLDTPHFLQIAMFQQRAFVGKTLGIPFSDTSIGPLRHDGYLTSFLSEYFGEVQPLSDEIRIKYGEDPCYRWGNFIRNFLWTNPHSPQIKQTVTKTAFFPDTQWYICNEDCYSIAVKAGHNAESHNHNDVGSFAVAVREKYVCMDPGSGVYTKDYFSASRYESLATSSRGHNLPIIDGCLQAEGIEHCGRFTSITEGKVEIEYAKAYPLDYLRSLKRVIQFDPDKLILSDECCASKPLHSFVQRWVFFEEPVDNGNSLSIAGCRLEYQQDDVNVSICKDSFLDNKNVYHNVYFVDLCAKHLDNMVTITTVFVPYSVK